MKHIGVVDAGISGLATAALLSRRYRVDLFEQGRRLGGHTNTVLVDGPNGTLPLRHRFPGAQRPHLSQPGAPVARALGIEW